MLRAAPLPARTGKTPRHPAARWVGIWLLVSLAWLIMYQSAAAQGGSYVVKPGDTLAGIAQRHETTVSVLLRLNGIGDPNLIRVGQKIVLPVGVQPAAGQELGASTAAAPTAPQVAGAPTRVYVVQPGDTLSSVAAQFQTTPAYLAELNRQAPTTRLAVGRALRVPVAKALSFATSGGSEIPTLGRYAVHTVQPGESLAAIAAAYGTSLRRTIEANPTIDPASVKPGMRVLVPPVSYAELFAQAPVDERWVPIYPAVPTAEKWISVDLDHQRAFAWEGEQLIKSFVISSGKARTPTVTGVFRIWAKVRAQTMEGGSRAAGDYYNLPNVEWVQYFYQDYSFHGAYWHNKFGTPMSHGCINMTNADAKWLFDWASPNVEDYGWHTTDAKTPGTLVIVHP